jgi:hypothetical protein
MDGDKGKALGYFGDATLRLLGLTAQQVAWLKNKKTCFVAGTPVHTETGPKPIEQVRAGERVWAFDRRRHAWMLARVLRTVERYADRLVSVRLADGTEVTGTLQHPVWVIEGEDLSARPAGDHGHDEPAGPTPGRWVALGALRPGDAVLVWAGRVSRVAAVGVEDRLEAVYNFEVEGLHCYAVGASGLLVHNGDCPDTGKFGAAKKGKANSPPAHSVPPEGSVLKASAVSETVAAQQAKLAQIKSAAQRISVPTTGPAASGTPAQILKQLPRYVPGKQERAYGILVIDGQAYYLRSGLSQATEVVNAKTFHAGIAGSLGVDFGTFNSKPLAAHVEAAAAAIMHKTGAKNATLYLNLKPCGSTTTDLGCWNLLKTWLPEGSGIQVFSPSGNVWIGAVSFP